MRTFKKDDIVKHFKREIMTKEQLENNPYLYLYKIIGTSRHTESGEELMIYLPLYETECTNGVDYAARPLDMFISEVDQQKYPNIKQKYRFIKMTKEEIEEYKKEYS